MKKMRNGRRGFTLLEIVIVVAIIVILSAGAFLGVAATVNHASDMQERLEANNGDHFEEYARNQVESYGKNMVYWDPIPNYTPENQAKKMKEQMLNEGWTDGEITFDYQEDGWHIIAEWDPSIPEHRGFQTPEDYKLWLSNYNAYIKMGYTAEEIEAGCKDGSTEIKPVWDASKHGGVSEEDYLKQKQGGGSGSTPTPVPTSGGNTPTPVPEGNSPTPIPTKAVTPAGVPDASSGRPNRGVTHVTTSAGTDASGIAITKHNSWGSNTEITVSLGTVGVESLVIYVPGDTDPQLKTYNGNVYPLGNGLYRVVFPNDNYQNDQNFRFENMGTYDDGIYIVEYTARK